MALDPRARTTCSHLTAVQAAHRRQVVDASGVRVVAVAEHGDIDHVRWRRILPDLSIDAGELDPLVEPAANPVVAAVCQTMGAYVVARIVLVQLSGQASEEFQIKAGGTNATPPSRRYRVRQAVLPRSARA